MAARDLRLLLDRDDEDSVPLNQKERQEILRRLERLEKIEAEQEALRRENRDLREQLDRSRRELVEQRKELQRLRRQIAGRDVATSPSQKLHRPAVPVEPQPKGRRPGGQPGHPPHARPRPDHVNETLDLTLEQCPDCGEKLGDPSDSYERFVTELVPAYLWVLKLPVHRYWCRRCQRYVKAAMDRAIPGRQFGPRLASTLVLLSMMGLPVRRIQETVATMVGLEVSVGAIQGLLEATAESLGPEYEAVRREGRAAHLVQPDETSMRVGGANWWAWSFATELAAYYELDPSRGQAVVDRVLGADFSGTVVSDDWCGYNVLRGRRGVCWIHINRHLQAVEVAHGIEPRGPRSLAPPKYQRAGHPPTWFLRFVSELRALLREAVAWSEQTPASATEARAQQAAVYEARVRALSDPESPDEDVGRISRNLVERMPYLFEFVRDAQIPWHNNAGERAIRSICVKRKMSGGMRSAVGARTYARLKTVHETAKRRGWEFLQVIMNALTRNLGGQSLRASSAA